MALHTPTDYLAAMERRVKTLSNRHHTATLFRDFVSLSACTLSRAADPSQVESRERDYLQTAGRYTGEELNQLSELLGMLVLELERQPFQDALGALYHRLEIHNAHAGQFFTPYSVCQMMARMTFHDAQDVIAARGVVRASEPCVGSGAMVIALCEAMHETGVNYQQALHVTATDLDLVAMQMAYIQLTLLHVPAVLYHGDSLSDSEAFSRWPTFAHTLGLWDVTLRRLDALPTSSPPEKTLSPPIAVTEPRSRGSEGVDRGKQSTRQLSLF